MAKLLKLRRGTTSQHSSFTGAEGEVTVDTDKESLVVHNGSQAGGFPLLRQDLSNLPAGTIDNADIASNAAIAGTKISPNFGAQNVTCQDLTLADQQPRLNFVDNAGSPNDPDYLFQVDGGSFVLHDSTNAADRLSIASNGTLRSHNNHDFSAGIDVTGYTTLTHSGTNASVIIGSGGHEMYSYHDSGGCGWATGAGGGFGELLYLDEGGSTARLYTGGSERLRAKDGGVAVTGLLEVSASMNFNGTLTGDRAVFQDDGAAGPTVSIMTDDNSPWALSIGNDTYNTATHKGLMFYQNNDGTMYQHYRGIGSFETVYFQTSDNTSTYNFLAVDPSINTFIYQGATNQVRFAVDGSEQVSVRGGSNYARISMQNSSGSSGRGGYVQSWSNGSTHEIGFARPNDGGWYIRNDRNDSNGAVVTYMFNDVRPASDNNMDLGASDKRWRNIYTTDLQLSNEGSSNDVDGTWGNWTLQEGEDHIFMLNNRNGKKYKMNLTEVS